ncbi:MAG: hypothetical protein LBU89_07325 [Fibromonadaceae bacterium]|jgi:uncharacterized protein involved in exopolysaccharide biosynthesis|nr:hypothetical protein [Fibromonadaceae bacterium]
MQTEDDDEEIDLLELTFSIAKRTLKRKALAAVVFVSVLGITFAVAFTATPFYKTNAKIIYQTSSGSQNSGLSALAAFAGVASIKSDDPSAYLGDIILSNNMLRSVLEEFDLQALWKVKPDSTLENWEIKLEYSMLEALKKGSYIVFSQDKKSGVITLTTEFEDPQVSYDMNNFIFRQLNDFLKNKMHFKATENRKFIEERLSEIKDNLKTAEDNLRAFRHRNRLRLDPTDELEDARLQRDVLMNQEIMFQLQNQYELAKIEEARDMPILDIIDIPMMPIEKSKPKKKLIVLAGGVAAIFFSILIVVLLDVFLEKKTLWKKSLSS